MSCPPDRYLPIVCPDIEQSDNVYYVSSPKCEWRKPYTSEGFQSWHF